MTIKTMPTFVYHEPDTLNGVLGLLDRYGGTAKIMAGGTDLIPKMKGGALHPEHVISIKNVNELSFIDYNEKTGLRFGSTVPIRVLENHPIIKKKYSALYEGAHCIASTQIRNAGTIVGNICNAVPSADSAPPLLVLGAKLKIVSSTGVRIVPIESFFTGVCKTVLADNELVTEIQISAIDDRTGSMYLTSTARKALDLAIVGVAAMVTAKNGICEDVRIGLGAVSITPKRATKSESMLIGQPLTDDLINKAAACASSEECTPITDIRATKEYRREMVRVLTRDAIKQAWIK